jgi:ESCRT-II complex subunit VPS25
MATKEPGDPGFLFPPFHSFPPSYTRQLWCDLIRDYCRVKRVFWLDIAGMKDEALFRNDKIGRRLSDQDILFFLGQLVSRGDGEWAADHMNCLVYWRRPHEWGDLIFQWVQKKALGGSVLTVAEIREGRWVEGEGTDERLVFLVLFPLNPLCALRCTSVELPNAVVCPTVARRLTSTPQLLDVCTYGYQNFMGWSWILRYERYRHSRRMESVPLFKAMREMHW